MSLSPASPSHEFFQHMAVHGSALRALLCAASRPVPVLGPQSSVLGPQLPVRSPSPTVPSPAPLISPPRPSTRPKYCTVLYLVLYIDLAVV
jgi:hypothetical protein